jgi:hypothetical protein
LCFSNYITTDDSTPSKSGLYFNDLSGCTVDLLDDLTKQDQADYTECFEYLYKKAQINLKIDVQRKLSDKFHIDKKLISRETSEYKSAVNTATDLAGVKIKVSLPKYARLQILSIGVYSENTYSSPEAEFYIYKENTSGDLLSTVSSELVEGKNTVQVYEEFEEDELFIAYDPTVLELRETKNKYYDMNTYFDEKVCKFNCVFGDEGTITQVNAGGLNIKFVLYCSMEKFICENLPLFQYALFYRLGVDTMKERITTQRVNKTSVLTPERAVELMDIHNEDYKAALDAATMNIKMTEDPVCFMCKSTVRSHTNLP